MGLEYEERKSIKDEILGIADERYVHTADCVEKQEIVNKKLSRDDTRIELLVHDFKVIKWLISTVAASSVGALVVSLFELILK